MRLYPKSKFGDHYYVVIQSTKPAADQEEHWYIVL